MPRYRFTGDTPLILFGVADPEGGTLTAGPGDVVEAPEGYEHPHLELIEDPTAPEAPEAPAPKRKNTPPTTETQE